MNHLAKNLVMLRQAKGLKQSDMQAINFKRTTWNNYESGVSEPNLDSLKIICDFFKVSLDNIVSHDLSLDVQLISKNETQKKQDDSTANSTANRTANLYETDKNVLAEPREPYPSVMPKVVTVDRAGNDNIVFVPVKAQAGYLVGYADPMYVETLPTHSLPGLKHRTYRAFEVEGDSMYHITGAGLYPNDWVIAEFVENVSEMIDTRVYVILGKDGVLIKRCINRLKDTKDPVLICTSDNKTGIYPPIILRPKDIVEVWECKRKISAQFTNPADLFNRITDMQGDIIMLNEQVTLLNRELTLLKESAQKS